MLFYKTEYGKTVRTEPESHYTTLANGTNKRFMPEFFSCKVCSKYELRQQ